MKTYGPWTMNHQTYGPYGWPEPPEIFGVDMIEHDAKSSTVSLVWSRLVYYGEQHASKLVGISQYFMDHLKESSLVWTMFLLYIGIGEN